MTNTPLMLPAAADSLARAHTAEAVGIVVKIMRGDEPGAGPILSARLKAAQTIIDRGHGRAVQAVISVPARHAVAARVAALTDDALLAIVAARRGGGSTGENGGPIGSHPAAGTIQDVLQPAETPWLHSAQALRPRHDDITDAEFEEITDSFDPCA